MPYTKPELRKSLQQARLAMPADDRRLLANHIAERLLQAIDWPQVRTVHCFEPIMRLGEVDLVDFVVALQTDREDIAVYTSRKYGDKWEVASADTDMFAQPVPAFDVIIVPMLGFDEKRHRIGYGGGYYDMFLASQPRAKKIGVCYEAGRVEQIPAESHDVALDMIITESHTYTS